jgi:hypothetical protein
MFIIEDERHGEWMGDYGTRDEAIAKLRYLSKVPWNEAPNIAPCASWESWGRRYELVEIDLAAVPSRELHRQAVLNVSSGCVEWLLKGDLGPTS